jgi:hypothetical protein
LIVDDIDGSNNAAIVLKSMSHICTSVDGTINGIYFSDGDIFGDSSMAYP